MKTLAKNLALLLAVFLIGGWFISAHIQTSGFIGSPTLPNNRKLDKSYELGISFPYLI
jgi:hypothetical protein